MGLEKYRIGLVWVKLWDDFLDFMNEKNSDQDCHLGYLCPNDNSLWRKYQTTRFPKQKVCLQFLNTNVQQLYSLNKGSIGR